MILMEEFGSLLPPTTEFHVGYIFGKQSTKFWLMCQEDIETMNKSIEKEKAKSSVMLWCEAVIRLIPVESNGKGPQKIPSVKTTTNRGD